MISRHSISSFYIVLLILSFFLLYILLISSKMRLSKPHLSHFEIIQEKLSNIGWPSSDWLSADVKIMDPAELQAFDQKDPRLINYIKARYLSPPSKAPYNLNQTRVGQGMGYGGDSRTQAEIQKVFGIKRGGFFVECGAFDGRSSNTLFLEKDFGWSGLLIECNPVLTPALRHVHRKAYIAEVCLSIFDHPKMTEITSMDTWPAASSTTNGTGIFPAGSENTSFTQYEVMSLPFYSLIAATGVKEVDVIILDIQGVELKILRHFPFDLILVKFWVVEVILYSEAEKNEIRQIMSNNGYKKFFDPNGADNIFIHKSV